MKSKIKLSRYAVITITVWAVCLVVLGAGYGMFYVPQTADLVQLKFQCNESKTELEQAQLAAQSQTREKMQLRHEETDILIKRFSTEHDADTELVFQIGQIASDLSLDEFSSKHLKEKGHPTIGKSKNLSEAWLKVEFFATFEQFAQFINQLERNCPVVFVEEVAFRRGSENSKGHDVSIQLSFLTEKETKNKSVAIAAN